MVRRNMEGSTTIGVILRQTEIAREECHTVVVLDPDQRRMPHDTREVQMVVHARRTSMT